MSYLKKDVHFNEIPMALKQTFHHDFSSAISKDVVLKMKHEGKITDRDLKIVKFLFKFHFATAQQIFDYIHDELEPTETVGSIQARLDKLVLNRILNKFCLSRIKENRVFPDALIMYCLDFGGKYLLMNFSNEDLTAWFSSENYKTSELIAKDLIVVDFYLKLNRATEGKIVFFESSVTYNFETTTLVPNFSFALSIGGELQYFIGEVARDEEIPLLFRKKMNKYNDFLCSKSTFGGWRKYFYSDDAPILFVITESDKLALLCSQVIHQSTDMNRYRLTTTIRLEDRELNGAGAFLRYLPDQGKCGEVQIPIFNPNKLD